MNYLANRNPNLYQEIMEKEINSKTEDAEENIESEEEESYWWVDREQEMMEAEANGWMEGCVFCLAVDCLPSEMASCQAGHRFCRDCVVTTAEEVLTTGRGVLRCLGMCDKEVVEDQLLKVLPLKILYKLMVNRKMKK
jgi:hypothetical protein